MHTEHEHKYFFNNFNISFITFGRTIHIIIAKKGFGSSGIIIIPE